MFWAFWLGNTLRITAACNFWSLIPPDSNALRLQQAFLSTLRNRKTSEKHNALRLFYLFAHAIFFLLTRSLTLPKTVAASFRKSEVWPPNTCRLCYILHVSSLALHIVYTSRKTHWRLGSWPCWPLTKEVLLRGELMKPNSQWNGNPVSHLCLILVCSPWG